MATEFDLLNATVPFDPVAQVDTENGIASGGMSYMAFNMLTPTGTGVPPWWSAARDSWLFDLFKRSDPLKIATNTFINKAVSIPLHIMARETAIKRHNRQALELQNDLQRNSGILKGFKNEFKKFLQDYLTQDNGAFMFVMGDAPGDQPLRGPATGLLHLDAARCQRTGDPQFPVIYHHLDGKRYALHLARVIAMSNMPSPKADMFDVGYSAVSCAIDMALELRDISVYSSEKFGSRPARQILYSETGATIEQLSSAVHHFENKLSQEGLHRFAKTLLLAPKVANQTLVLKTLDMSSAPDGFDRQEVTIIDLALLASAFGLDLRDLAMSFGVAGSTKSDAEVQNLKGRGKGVHEVLETFSERMEQVFLPAQLRISFDTMDDEQDQMQANNRNMRSQARERDLRGGITTIHVEREHMFEVGDITAQQFREMELMDGRTVDGMDIMFLFDSADPVYQEYLGPLGESPTDVLKNDPLAMRDQIAEQKSAAYKEMEKVTDSNMYWKLREVLAALDKLQAMYDDMPDPLDQVSSINGDPLVDADNMGEEGDLAPEQVTDATGVTQPEAETETEAPADATKQIPDDLWEDDLPAAVAEQVSEIVEQYGEQFDAIVTQAAAGEINRNESNRLLEDLIAGMLLLLFLKGARVSPGDAGIQERALVINIIETNLGSLQGLLDSIYAGNYGAGGLGLEALLRRVEIWQNMATNAYYQGLLQRPDDPYLRWVIHPMKDHCRDCVRLNGQVHRASEWRASGWVPRSMGLECRGFYCGCSFVETSGPSRGAF